MSGDMLGLDGGPLAGATVIARVPDVVTGAEARSRRAQGVSGVAARAGAIEQHQLAETTTDADGAFTLTGPLDVPVSKNPDGSVQLEILVLTDELARFYYVNATPPESSSDPWTWSDVAPDSTVVEDGNSESEDLAGEPVEDVVISFEPEADESGQPGIAAKSASDPWATGSADTVDAPAGLSQPPMSQDEADDVAEDQAAIDNGTMDAVEADFASRMTRCSQGPGGTYWEDTGTTVNRRVPIHFSAIRTKYKHQFEWEQTSRTSMSIAVTGTGRNYKGGLSFSQENVKKAGASNTKTAEGQTHQWYAGWKYKKQALWCFNAGYPYKVGRTRWLPTEWTNSFTQAENVATRFVCDADYRGRVEGNLWVQRDNSSTWAGWFEIAGVKLDAKQTRSDADEIEDDNLRIKATYLKRDSVDHGFLCGRGAKPTDAPFTEEVAAP
jgi:hypothetical protein